MRPFNQAVHSAVNVGCPAAPRCGNLKWYGCARVANKRLQTSGISGCSVAPADQRRWRDSRRLAAAHSVHWADGHTACVQGHRTGWLKLTVPVHDPSADDSTHTPLTQKDGMVDEIRAALPCRERWRRTSRKEPGGRRND